MDNSFGMKNPELILKRFENLMQNTDKKDLKFPPLSKVKYKSSNKFQLKRKNPLKLKFNNSSLNS